MNTSLFRITLLAVGALALPHTASASFLLVGYNNFEVTPTQYDDTPDEFLSGFSGSLFKNNHVAGTPTSDDGFYGPDSIALGGIAVGTPGNQSTITSNRLGGAQGVTLTVTNNTQANYVLSSLLFDGRHNGQAGPSATYAVSWNAPGGSGSQGGMIASGTGGLSGNNYNDFIVNLSGIILGAGEAIVFTWSSDIASARLDNIALTAIPEPASLIALGLVLGSGLLLRQRPRQLSPSLA